jgi:hypothetical protein
MQEDPEEKVEVELLRFALLTLLSLLLVGGSTLVLGGAARSFYLGVVKTRRQYAGIAGTD